MPSFSKLLHRLGLWAAGLAMATTSLAQPASPTDSLRIRRLYNEALQHGQSYDNLRELTSMIGGRLSGSPQAQQAVAWSQAHLQQLGLDRVYVQPVLVPHWVRGTPEKATLFVPGCPRLPLAVCALGGSVGTGGRLRAGVVEVRSWAELAALPDTQVRGKFVFFNRALEATRIEPFQAYAEGADQRYDGAAQAARRGAIGALVRSLTFAYDNLPHTGALRYAEQVPKVPAAAISTVGAEQLSQQLRRHPALTLELTMTCQNLPDMLSYNVIGELRGTQLPGEIITVGGHLDSWDLAQGAHDDGAGVVQSIEVLRLLLATGYRPARTVRAVLYMNEENGTRGGLHYAQVAAQAAEQHVAVLESDAGGFTPRGFRVDASPSTLARLRQWSPAFRPYHSEELASPQRGIDIAPMKGLAKALISYDCDDQRFFDLHHSAADTFATVNRRELALGGASLAALVYLLSEYGL